MADLSMTNAKRMKELVSEAVLWGFDEPDNLTNQNKRIKWLRACREKAWDALANGADVPPPGKPQPADAKPRRAPVRPKPRQTIERVAPSPGTTIEQRQPTDVFPPSGNRRRKRPARSNGKADLCKVPASEVNEWMRSLSATNEG